MTYVKLLKARNVSSFLEISLEMFSAASEDFTVSEYVPVFAAIATMQASKVDLFIARIFGKKVVTTDSGCTVTMRIWRGKAYLAKCARLTANAKITGG